MDALNYKRLIFELNKNCDGGSICKVWMKHLPGHNQPRSGVLSLNQLSHIGTTCWPLGITCCQIVTTCQPLGYHLVNTWRPFGEFSDHLVTNQYVTRKWPPHLDHFGVTWWQLYFCLSAHLSCEWHIWLFHWWCLDKDIKKGWKWYIQLCFRAKNGSYWYQTSPRNLDSNDKGVTISKISKNICNSCFFMKDGWHWLEWFGRKQKLANN